MSKYVIIHDDTGTEMTSGERFYDPRTGAPLLFHRWTEGASGQVYVEVRDVNDNGRLKTRKLHDLGLHAAQPIPVHKRDDAPSDYEKLLAGAKSVAERVGIDYDKFIADTAAEVAAREKREKGLPADERIMVNVVDEHGNGHTQWVVLPHGTRIDTVTITYNGVRLAQVYPPDRTEK